MPPRERRGAAGGKPLIQEGQGHLSGQQLKLLFGALRGILLEEKENLETSVLAR